MSNKAQYFINAKITFAFDTTVIYSIITMKFEFIINSTKNHMWKCLKICFFEVHKQFIAIIYFNIVFSSNNQSFNNGILV